MGGWFWVLRNSSPEHRLVPMKWTSSVFAVATVLLASSCFFDSSSGSSDTTPLRTKLQAAISVDSTPALQPVPRGAKVELRADTTESPVAGRRASAPSKPLEVSFLWVATLPSPTVSSRIVQACDISIDGPRAYVAYNDSGDPFNGAIAVLKLNGNSVPVLEDLVAFSGMDINAIFADPGSGRVYFGGQADPDRFGFRAFAGWFKNTQIASSDLSASIVPLPSYATTSIVRSGHQILIGTGAADGRLVRLGKDLDTLGSVALPDIRSLAANTTHANADLSAILTGGADGGSGALHVDNGGVSIRVPLPGFTAPYAKATVAVLKGASRWAHDEDALVAATLSEGGLRIWKVKDGAADSVWALANPSANPAHTTNSVSQSGGVPRTEKLLFAANGEYGMRVVEVGATTGFGRVAGVFPVPVDPTLPRASFNHVVFADPYVIAATGRSGIQIYALEE